MKLNIESLRDRDAWAGYVLPDFDIPHMTALTREKPIWLHIGAGNIFRAFPAVMQQDLLEKGLIDRGITVCECFDEEIIPACYAPYDRLSLLVTLKADGSTEKRVIASVAETFSAETEPERLNEIFTAPTLQMVSFTITEKAYAISSDLPETAISRVTAGLLARFRVGSYPVALLSMDNCAGNGDKLGNAVRIIAKIWITRGIAEPDFLDYLTDGRVSFPWSMIDKITPRPSETVAETLRANGYEDARIIETKKHTYVSSFVNAESCQYLVVEDDFPNGRPPLEQAGVFFTNRETVQKAERMKVSACLNPLHTILAVSGMLLNYPTISECTRDPRLAAFIRRAAYDESLPVAVNPGVINPEMFLKEVLEERLPNPFIPDTPARIACDTSQKIPVRFGETLKARLDTGLPVDTLEAIPFFFALWLSYLLGVNDNGQKMTLSPDPRLNELSARLSDIHLGEKTSCHPFLQPILSDATIFGVDLFDNKVRLGEKVEMWFTEMVSGPGAVARALERLYGKGKNGL